MNGLTLFYADDDEDDLAFFDDAVSDVTQNNEAIITLFLIKNGADLIENIKKNRTTKTIVFLDLNMPQKSGFQFIKEMRNLPEFKKIPIIIYSTSNNVNDIKSCFELGANLYISKPSDYNDLMKIIVNMYHIDWENQELDFKTFVYRHY
jgi:CheY-like chemotaxis protein